VVTPVTDPASTSSPDDGHALFTSAVYTADAEDEVTRSAAEWLEEQARHPFIVETAGRTMELLRVQPGWSVLDAGCGTGVLLSTLADATGTAGRVTGLDRSAPFLARARARIDELGLSDRVDLVQGDVTAMPFADGTFDAVHTERVLMHLDEPDDAIRELIRVTRPGGTVLCAEVFPAGVEIDHPDQEVMQRLNLALVSDLRNPRMGIELRRRFVHAGLSDVTGVGTVFFESHVDDDEVAETHERGRQLVERGEVDAERMERALLDFDAANDGGYHSAMAIIFVVRGTIPAVDPISRE
jgi:ubiquinone/menaquinone biosynthesis C-methylase UbiE